MDADEVIKWISDNHQILILGGGIISFIGIFLPFWAINSYFGYGSISLSNRWVLWLYLLLIGAILAGHFYKYAETYPYMYLAIGVVLILLTLSASNIVLFEAESAYLDYTYGFLIELAGSVAITLGGYYYYKNQTDNASNPG